MVRNVCSSVFVCSRTQCSRTQSARGLQCSRTRVRTVFGHTITGFGGPIPCGSSTHAGLDTLGSPGSPDALGSPSSPGHPGTRVVAGLWHGLATGHGSMPALPLLKHSLPSARNTLFWKRSSLVHAKRLLLLGGGLSNNSEANNNAKNA